MSEEFSFNALQYVDFSKDQDDMHSDSYFESNEETVPPNGGPIVREDVAEAENHETSDVEDDAFFSPMDNENGAVSNSTVFLRGQLRRSLSMGHLPSVSSIEAESSNANNDENVDNHVQPRPGSACSLNNNRRLVRIPSQDHINRLAQPKRYVSQNSLNKEEPTLAQALVKYQSGTPRRFRSKPAPKINKAAPFSFITKPQSPKFLTTGRTRPVTAVSKEEQERREFEEVRKFKIKANPVNKKAMKGPLKPQIDKKPATVVEPFRLTEVRNKEVVVEKAPGFKAQPLPKSLHNPFKVQSTAQAPTKAQTPNLLKRLTRSVLNQVEKQEIKAAPQPFKPTRTQPVPFSFEKRDKQLLKKKEEFFQKVLEEEKKAREFHAKPPPKSILRPKNASQEHSEAGSSKSFKSSTEELDAPVFKARPATVLMIKPFEPKKDDNHVVKIEAFQFTTDERIQARHKFEEKRREREAEAEAYKREHEEMVKRVQEEEVLRLRKQMEHKAQPIKKYKEIQIQHINKVTVPISPKFETDRIRNKENIQQ